MMRVLVKEWLEKLVLMRRPLVKLFALEARRRRSEECTVLNPCSDRGFSELL